MTVADSTRLMQRVAETYSRHLRESSEASACLEPLNLGDAELLEDFNAGYSDGSLAGMLGGEAIEALRSQELLTETGEETLRGCVVLPVRGEDGAIAGFCGLQPGNSTRPGEILVPKCVQGLIRGTLARDGTALFIATRVLDAFSLWRAGFRNAVVAVGDSRSVPSLEQIILENECTQAWVCSDNGDPNGQILRSLTHALAGFLTIAVAAIPWPPGVAGPHEFFQTRTRQDFKALLASVPKPQPTQSPGTSNSARCFTEIPDGLDACFDGRRYEIRAIRKPGPGRLRATLRALGDNGRFVVETVNFYYLRSRRGFVAEAARMFRQSLEAIETDLGRMTDELERYTERLAVASAPAARTIEGADRAKGLKLGRAADLVDQIVRDMGSLGVIGEETNRLLSYLVMTSRKMPEPLALLILSGSGAGKNHLQDAALALCPEEDLVKLTSLTDQALFYRGENSLRHKVLALEEHFGAKGAAYPLRSLISARKLVIETTVKNLASGRLETQINTVYGPTAVFQTTTSPNTDSETRSRFIPVSIDETPGQTRAILERQRHLHTLEGMRLRQRRERILDRHHAFQRLLQPIPVVNPYEPLLSYPDQHLMVRRDQPKYLQLILAVTFLHQMQRPVRHDPELGDYIETTLDDIAIANDLAHRVLGNSLADLSAPGRELLSLIEDQVRKKHCNEDSATFTRRELREAIHWGDTRLRVHLRELVDLEYLAPLQGRFGLTYRYCLLSYNGHAATGRCLQGLKSVEELRMEANLAGLAPTSHPQKREVATAPNPSTAAGCLTETATSRIFGESRYLQSVEAPCS